MNFITNLWDVLNELSIWLLLGAAFAGILHVWMPKDFFKQHLGQSNWWSIFKAACIGVPMPLCSCAVIPTGIGLKKDGASDGAAVSFLISTPQTGVDSISVAWGFLGWPFALFKVLSAFLMGVIGGHIVNVINKSDKNQDTTANTNDTLNLKPCCAEPIKKEIKPCCEPPAEEPQVIKSCCEPPAEEPQEIKSCCEQEAAPEPEQASCCSPQTASKSPSAITQAYNFAINDLLYMIWFWLLIGILISAALSTWISSDSLSNYAWASGFSALLITLFISLPLYVCATASVPIAASLISAGFPTGAALVFLMAGPASNIATIGAVAKAFGGKVVTVYLLVVIIGSLALGYAFDQLVPVSLHSHAHMHEHQSWHQIPFSILLCIFMVIFAAKDLKKFLAKATT